jgi:hypothetical protein
MLRAGDEALVLASDEQSGQLASLFTQPRTGVGRDADGRQ